MSTLLKQSATARALTFLMVDSTDHITPKTGLSPTVTIRKEGGSFASPSGAVTEIANGWYQVAGNATDTATLGSLLLHATGTGADPSDREYTVVAFDPLSATNLGLSALPTASPNANGGLPILSSSGTTLAYTISTLTTYTGNTPQTGDAYARIGATGSGLTSLAPASTALSTAVWTAPPTGFLGATFPTGTIANTTNITAGTITTVTNVTNAPTAGDFTATMKASITSAVPAASAIATAVWVATGRTLSTFGFTVDTNANATEAAIKTKTDNLPASPADVSNIPTAFDIASVVLAGLPIFPSDPAATSDIPSAATIAAAVRDVNNTTPIANTIGADLATARGGALRVTSMTQGALSGNFQFTEEALELAPSSGGGGTPLTAQQTRDAMKLAASAGDPAEGSIDAKIDALSAGSGMGAYAITVTVTDGSSPLQNAKVRITDGITPATGITDMNGNASFSLDAGTYGVTATKAGYQFTPTSRTVVGNESGTLTNDLEMTLVAIPSPPIDPSKGTAFGSMVKSDGSGKSGVIVTATLVGAAGPYAVGSVLIPKVHTNETNANGQWSLDLYGNADILPTGTFWRIDIGQADYHKNVTIVSGQVTNTDDLIT